MIRIRNRGVQARPIDLSRDYPGIGRTIYLRPKETRDGLPDEIATEKRLTRLVARGIVTIIKGDQPTEKKPEKETRSRRAIKQDQEE